MKTLILIVLAAMLLISVASLSAQDESIPACTPEEIETVNFLADMVIRDYQFDFDRWANGEYDSREYLIMMSGKQSWFADESEELRSARAEIPRCAYGIEVISLIDNTLKQAYITALVTHGGDYDISTISVEYETEQLQKLNEELFALGEAIAAE